MPRIPLSGQRKPPKDERGGNSRNERYAGNRGEDREGIVMVGWGGGDLY